MDGANRWMVRRRQMGVDGWARTDGSGTGGWTGVDGWLQRDGSGRMDGWQKQMDGQARIFRRQGMGAGGWVRNDGWMDRRGWTDADKQMVGRTQTDGQAQLDDYQVCIGSDL